MDKLNKKVITDHFRGNIFEAYAHYNAWKVIAYSKSTGVVSKEMAERYVEIQKYHGQFFGLSERAFLISFIILLLHPFDNDTRAFSLHKVDIEKTKNFIAENKLVLNELKLVRNKVFAHSEIDPESGTFKRYSVPSVERLDDFFKKLVEFYNKLCKEVDDSITMFDNAELVKREVEQLFMNLYRGENVRKKEIDIEWLWKKDNKKISDII